VRSTEWLLGLNLKIKSLIKPPPQQANRLSFLQCFTEFVVGAVD